MPVLPDSPVLPQSFFVPYPALAVIPYVHRRSRHFPYILCSTGDPRPVGSDFGCVSLLSRVCVDLSRGLAYLDLDLDTLLHFHPSPPLFVPFTSILSVECGQLLILINPSLSHIRLLSPVAQPSCSLFIAFTLFTVWAACTSSRSPPS